MDGKKTANFIIWKRKELSLTVEQLAAEIGVQRYLLEKWEDGELPSTEYLIPLSKALETTVEELLLGREEKTTEKEDQLCISTVADVEQIKESKEEKGYYEILNEKIKDTDYANYEMQSQRSNGFWDGERKFGYVLCSFFLALMLIINLSNLFAWVNRPRQITIENCSEYLSVDIYATEVFDPTAYEVKLTAKKGSYPIYNLSVTVKVTFERISIYQLGEEEVIRYAELTAPVLREGQSVIVTVYIPHHMYYERGGEIIEARGSM